MRFVITNTTLFILMMVVGNSQLKSQGTYQPQPISFTPVTPNAAALGKFGEFPVNLSSGLVDITIPLYEVKTAKLSVPISLKYHASGIKPSDQASSVGLGWALQAGGMISRNVMEKIDDFNGYLTPNTVIKPTNLINPDAVADDFDYIKSFYSTGNQPPRDAQPDIFNYNLSGKGGKFFFSSDKVNVITIPYDKVKITNTAGAGLLSFTIVDTDGKTYLFGKTLDGTNCYEETYTRTGINDLEDYAKTSWLLSAIISADKTDTIRFSYTSNAIYYDYGYSDNVTIRDKHSGGYANPTLWKFPVSTWGLQTPQTNVMHFNGTQLTLDQITFKNGKVVFEKDLRTDLGSNASLINRISKISIYQFDAISNTYNKVKSISLNQGYFSPYQRLKLNSLSINEETDMPVQTYSFTYNPTTPSGAMTKAIDHWGYYNGRTSNTTLITDKYISDGAANDPEALAGSAGTSDREPDIAGAQSCILTSITYPTGGRTDFIYELNRYSEANLPDKSAGGLRIRQIKSYNSTNATPVVKTYVYGENENGTGTLITPINNYTYYESRVILKFFQLLFEPVQEEIRSRTLFSTPFTGLTGMDGQIVYYTTVTEYDGTPQANNGKTVYKYNYYGDTYIYRMPGSDRYYRQDYSWKRGHLLEKTVYTAFGEPIQKEVNGYGQVNQQWNGNVGYIITPLFQIVDGSQLTPPLCGICPYGEYVGMHSYNTFSVETGNFKLINSAVYNYHSKDANKAQVKQAFYEYDPNIYELSKVTNYLNDGYEVTELKYPLNYNSNITTSDAFINGIKNLTAINDLKEVVETYKKKYKTDNTLVGTLDAIVTQFKSNAPYPEIIYKLKRSAPKTTFSASTISGTAFIKDANYFPEVQFTNYLGGNLVQQQMANDVIKSYIWDYNNVLPIAEINNSTSNDVAYTSFESDGTGNWSGVNKANISAAIQPLSGFKVYSFAGTSLSKPTLNTGSAYIVSYWSNSGTAYSLTGTAVAGWPKMLKTVTLNGATWYLWEHKITGATTISISGTGYIDELRLYPDNAQMTTYTYKPLVGLTSMSDINNMTTYYEYDSFGRPKLIKDFLGSIIKKFSYQYQSINP
jgi:hypothetical protein